MGYISEDYCSEELSGMLMERGYIGATNTYLGKDDINVKQITIQSAMKWLREKHNLGVFPSWSQVFGCYGCRLYYLNKGSQELYSLGAHYDTYEEACEAAIKYCLENLI